MVLVACGPEAAPQISSKTTTNRPPASPLIPTAAPTQISQVAPENVAQSRTMGDPAAPIVFVEYSDYQ